MRRQEVEDRTARSGDVTRRIERSLELDTGTSVAAAAVGVGCRVLRDDDRYRRRDYAQTSPPHICGSGKRSIRQAAIPQTEPHAPILFHSLSAIDYSGGSRICQGVRGKGMANMRSASLNRGLPAPGAGLGGGEAP